ncbi:eukaryotic protein [Schizosaccharomyces japonicus yFS275]|uniref:Eukaryotic protein n=1 Tax=Schizosaccharomyces japonicus (strain yFS275 / FY16936) TaxID=402676 RepID=B6K0K3_SCHJY|nr:eukaryotic protein [Schizosaccharomyces japonicus yFS275]EEB07474.1 eukaryotic protein [Schizosaccharomyces japonicus yFS275]
MLQQPQSNVFHRAGMDFLAVEEGPATLRTYSVGNVAHDYLDVHVPPKPEEPLNCCQSGCPICVWDIYADDLREYQDARIRAKKAFIERKMAVPTELKDQQLNAKDPLEQLPPSIHAFVDLEKRLAKKKLENDS